MEQLPLYASQGFGGGGGSSGGGSLRGGGRMRPHRGGGWRRGRQRRVTSSSLYKPRLAVGEIRGQMLSHAHLNQGVGTFCRWWRRSLSVAVQSIGGGGRGGGEKGSWRKF